MLSPMDKDKIVPELERALELLHLNDLTALEESFLATDAFLSPWSTYRDSCLFVRNTHACEPNVITRLDILWFYTQFDQSLRRHDPRAEKPDAHLAIDKSEWGNAEFEKHLYAWLLQNFHVGKTYNLYGFRYLELRSICTAWQEVFIPIIEAVRASYSVRGRRHYGRLALFIEERCPSRLAFPEGNIIVPGECISLLSPHGVASGSSGIRGISRSVLTKINYDEAEKELRNVYPQYGGLIERPKSKQKMEEWLEEQRARVAHRKNIESPDGVQYVPRYQAQVAQRARNGDEDHLPNNWPSDDMRSCSPIRKYSDSIRRSWSMNAGTSRFGKTKPQQPLSPTRTRAPDTPQIPVIPLRMRLHFPTLRSEKTKSPLHGGNKHVHVSEDAFRSDDSISCALPQAEKPFSGARRPSYEGNGYHSEISLMRLHASNVSADGRFVETDRIPSKPRCHLPATIKMPPKYVDHSHRPYHTASSPRMEMKSPPGETKPESVAWPGFHGSPPRLSHAAPELKPPIPAKSPERWATGHGQQSGRLSHGGPGLHERRRIVSKENIRAALGNLSPESSMEDLRMTPATTASARGASPPRLETYNSHMFPKKRVT